MPVITFVEFDGTEHQIDADSGLSVMETVGVRLFVAPAIALLTVGSHCQRSILKRNRCWAYAQTDRPVRA